MPFPDIAVYNELNVLRIPVPWGGGPAGGYYGTKKKLLIADDSEMNRAILANMLEQDFEIMEVSDGKEALAALQIYRKDLSALLLDIVMPEMDGFQVLEEMKQRQWLEDVPTVMISAETGSGYIDRAFELGAVDYINRPFSATVVRQRIINTILLHTRRQEMMDILTSRVYRQEKSSEVMLSILNFAVEYRNGEGGGHMSGVEYLTGLLLRRLMAVTAQYSPDPGGCEPHLHSVGPARYREAAGAGGYPAKSPAS